MRGIANHFAVVLFVITACTGTKSGGSPDSGVDNSVEIWSISGGTRRLEWSTGDEEMRPIDGRWQDDSTVIYRVVPERLEAKADTIRMQLPFRDGGWKIAGRVP